MKMMNDKERQVCLGIISRGIENADLAKENQDRIIRAQSRLIIDLLTEVTALKKELGK